MRARRVPWLLFAVSVGVVAAFVVLGRDPVSGEPVGWDAIWLLPFLAYGAVGALVASRRPRNRIGWVFLAVGLFGALATLGPVGEALEDGWIPARSAMIFLSFVGWFGGLGTMLTAAILLFPDGRLPGPRWRVVVWAAAVSIPVAGISEYLTSDLADAPEAAVSAAQVVGGIALVVLVAAALASVASVVVRFRRSGGAERQQLKWFTYAAGLLTAGLVVVTVGEVTRRYDPESVVDLAVTALFVLTITGIPVSAGVAVLRYRLYDIDVVINRTLVYGLLTGILAASYLGLVALMQLVLQPLTPQSDLSIVISTLVVAALFRPVRARLQTFIDRRFYRRKYDAAATLDGFSARLRDQVDLESLRSEVVTVVGTTVQPAHASLWLRPREEAR